MTINKSIGLPRRREASGTIKVGEVLGEVRLGHMGEVFL
jgi:hypothetical protein